MVMNFFTRLLLLLIFNVAGYWVAKLLILLSLSVKVHTDFGVVYTVWSTHILVAAWVSGLAFVIDLKKE